MCCGTVVLWTCLARSLAIGESECSHTLHNISDKSVYVPALQGYNKLIEKILSSNPIDHVSLEHFQAAGKIAMPTFGNRQTDIIDFLWNHCFCVARAYCVIFKPLRPCLKVDSASDQVVSVCRACCWPLWTCWWAAKSTDAPLLLSCDSEIRMCIKEVIAAVNCGLGLDSGSAACSMDSAHILRPCFDGSPIQFK